MWCRNSDTYNSANDAGNGNATTTNRHAYTHTITNGDAGSHAYSDTAAKSYSDTGAGLSNAFTNAGSTQPVLHREFTGTIVW